MRCLKPLLAATIALLATATAASAHLERPSYWPDPKPDTSVSPAAGGKVPTARGLYSALRKAPPGTTRVVCQGRVPSKKKLREAIKRKQKRKLRRAKRAYRRGVNRNTSIRMLKQSIAVGRREGYSIRPSQEARSLSKREARRLLRFNERLLGKCRFSSIQEAVNASRNNDRVVIMPGLYTEPASRRAPLNDKRCNPSLLQDDQTDTPTPSYEYQVTCPNDQNLIYVQGRALKGRPLEPPRPDRHGIPSRELGDCVRCNLQMEGSGLIPEDVIIDGGSGYANPLDPKAKPGEYKKHVVLRTDRSDGFVGRNFLLRGAAEHGFYTEETDGILLDKVKFFWALDYGHLSFTTDHNVIQNCEGFGAGDAAVYPGAAPQTGEFRDKQFYPEQRYNTVVRQCDLHGSTLAYSGSMGNSVRITENHIYGNTAGISSDTLSAPGHPGYPADGMLIDNNLIYSNNLDLYGVEPPPVEPLVPMPIGSAIVWPGMNGGIIRDNHIFDNWRHGTVLTAVPDAVAGTPEGNVDPGVHCAMTAVSTTSCGNRYYNNVMGRPPAGFRFHEAVDMFGNRHGAEGSVSLPNGVDFWWDEFAGNDGNCWYDNIGSDGTPGSITGSGQGLPPDPLPGDCGASVGLGDLSKLGTLLDCALWSRGDGPGDHPLCYWFQMPPQPGSAQAQAQSRAMRRQAELYRLSPQGRDLQRRIDELGTSAPTLGR
jgi:Right handed beta helix region